MEFTKRLREGVRRGVPTYSLIVSVTSVAAMSACAHAPRKPEAPPEPLTCLPATHPEPHDHPSPQEAVDQMTRVGPYVRDCALAANIDDDIVTVKYFLSGQSGKIEKLNVLRRTRDEHDRRFNACVRQAFTGVCFAPFVTEKFAIQYPFRVNP